MKKSLLFLFILTLFVGFSSCSSDDDENEPFKWEGDIENYNPLLGTWKYKDNNSVALRFSEDKILYRIDYKSSGDETIEIGPFEINKSAYRTGVTGIIRYKLEGDILTQFPNQNSDNDSKILIRKK